MNDKHEPDGSDLVKTEPSEESEKPELPPPPTPPQTKTPVQFNQQLNFYQQIPSSAWGGLSNEQIVDLSKSILIQMDRFDERQFKFAMDQAKKLDSTRRRILFSGSSVAIIGFALAAYLALNGHTFVAMSISIPLATILAVIVGNKIVGS